MTKTHQHPGGATKEEKERTERLKRIRRCEEELQILRSLPADKVTEWIATRRKEKNDFSSSDTDTNTNTSAASSNVRAAANKRSTRPFLPNSTGPVASERVRVRQHSAQVEALIAQGRFRQQSEFPRNLEIDEQPLKIKEPGAIRLTDLQQRMVEKNQKRQELQENQDETSRQELLTATASLSPRHRAKMRRSMGQKKSKAQQRYQRLLQARHRASELLQHRHERQSYGVDERALAERQTLVKQVRVLREKLIDPDTLAEMRERCKSYTSKEVDENILPIPIGANVERIRIAHLQSLGVLRADKEWWRAVRHGEEKDIRTCMDQDACWTGWKKPERLLGGQSLYGRASKPPKSHASSPGSSPKKGWFVEPALGDKSRGLSDWWLNYALGALAESSEAERAIEEAEQSGMMSGKSFMEVLERQTLKIVDHYKTQMSREQEEVSCCKEKKKRNMKKKRKKF